MPVKTPLSALLPKIAQILSDDGRQEKDTASATAATTAATAAAKGFKLDQTRPQHLHCTSKDWRIIPKISQVTNDGRLLSWEVTEPDGPRCGYKVVIETIHRGSGEIINTKHLTSRAGEYQLQGLEPGTNYHVHISLIHWFQVDKARWCCTLAQNKITLITKRLPAQRGGETGRLTPEPQGRRRNSVPENGLNGPRQELQQSGFQGRISNGMLRPRPEDDKVNGAFRPRLEQGRPNGAFTPSFQEENGQFHDRQELQQPGLSGQRPNGTFRPRSEEERGTRRHPREENGLFNHRQEMQQPDFQGRRPNGTFRPRSEEGRSNGTFRPSRFQEEQGGRGYPREGGDWYDGEEPYNMPQVRNGPDRRDLQELQYLRDRIEELMESLSLHGNQKSRMEPRGFQDMDDMGARFQEPHLGPNMMMRRPNHLMAGDYNGQFPRKAMGSNHANMSSWQDDRPIGRGRGFHVRPNGMGRGSPRIIERPGRRPTRPLPPYLVNLHDKACKFVSENQGNMRPIRVLYRNKPFQYFADILRKKDGNMVPYTKDNNGDPRSPINAHLKGLFFSGTVEENGSLPDSSPFGNTRFILPARNLFRPNSNLYFTDFYCNNKDRRPHYVTVVVTEQGSKADQICSSRLLPLDIWDNPFLCLDPQSDCVWITQNVWVEIFYTETINIIREQKMGGAWLDGSVEILGKGQSSPGGIPKNADCPVCNID